MKYGAANAALLQGGSATSMIYRPDSRKEPELLTSIYSMNGDTELKSRRLPTYWMVAAQ